MKVHGVAVPDSLGKRWLRSQSCDMSRYERDSDNPIGLFSVPQLSSATEAGKIVNSRCDGLILDVGCGCYHGPSYMQGGRFIGIDPFVCRNARDFPAAQAIGERLPFGGNSFDAITMMSVVDHFLDLDMAFSEARRVLIDDGLLFIWFMPMKSDDHHHCQILSLDTLSVALRRNGFVVTDKMPIKETTFVWDLTCLVQCRKGDVL